MSDLKLRAQTILGRYYDINEKSIANINASFDFLIQRGVSPQDAMNAIRKIWDTAIEQTADMS